MHITHAFPPFCSHFSRAPTQGKRGCYIQILACPLTHCGYTVFPLITTSGQLGSPFLPLPSEPHGFRFPAGRTPDDNQTPCLEGTQTMTDIALVPWQGTHQVLMTARDHAA